MEVQYKFILGTVVLHWTTHCLLFRGTSLKKMIRGTAKMAFVGWSRTFTTTSTAPHSVARKIDNHRSHLVLKQNHHNSPHRIWNVLVGCKTSPYHVRVLVSHDHVFSLVPPNLWTAPYQEIYRLSSWQVCPPYPEHIYAILEERKAFTHGHVRLLEFDQNIWKQLKTKLTNRNDGKGPTDNKIKRFQGCRQQLRDRRKISILFLTFRFHFVFPKVIKIEFIANSCNLKYP